MADAEPFETFVRTHQHMVFATAIRLLGNHTDAEDIAQQVFVKAFEHFEMLVSSAAAAGWLKVTTRNACLNHLTRYRRRWRFFSELDDDANGGEGFEARLPSNSSPALALETADQHARLEAALRALPDHQRVPLVLFHFEHASYQEIADTLRVSLGKVKTDMHRGREALRALLEREHERR